MQTSIFQTMILELLAFILLLSPLVWELITDANGDFDKKADILVRGVIASISATLAYVITERNILAAFNLSVALHFSCFDYLINIILYGNGIINNANWFSNTGKKGVVDNLPYWKQLNPWWKLAIRIGYLGIALLIYF